MTTVHGSNSCYEIRCPIFYCRGLMCTWNAYTSFLASLQDNAELPGEIEVVLPIYDLIQFRDCQ